MATHVSGIAIVIRAFLPTGKSLDEQFTAISLVKEAHASGDYSAVLKAAKIDEVKAEQKTRRMEDEPQAGQNANEGVQDDAGASAPEPTPTDPSPDAEVPDTAAPAFLKKGQRPAG